MDTASFLREMTNDLRDVLDGQQLTALDVAAREIDHLNVTITKARDLIGDQRGDITGAALDAWAILSNAR